MKVLRKLIQKYKFKFSIFKVNHAHKKCIKHCLKSLNFCLNTVNELIIPTTEREKEIMKNILDLYDEVIDYMNKDINRCRNIICEQKTDSNIEEVS